MQRLGGRDYALLGSAVACPALTTGLTTLFPLWVLPWAKEFGAARSTIMLTFALAGIMTTLLMPFVGRLLVRAPARLVVASGGAVMGLGFLALPLTSDYWQVAVVYAVAHAVGGVLCGPLPCQSVAVRQHPQAAGKIGGLMMLGLAAGGGLLPLILGPVMIQYGWRTASAACGLAILVIVPSLALGFLREPHVVGVQAESARSPAVGGAKAIGARQALATPAFWLILVAVLPLLASNRAIQTNLAPIMTDVGGGQASAAYVLSMMAAASAAGAVVVGWLADRIDPRLVLTGVAALFGAGLAALLTQPGLEAASAAMFVIGLASGGTIPLLGVFVVRCFGAQGYAPVAGLMGPFMMPAVFGPVAAGWLRDQTGDYSGLFLGAIAVIAVGAFAVRSLARRAPAVQLEPA